MKTYWVSAIVCCDGIIDLIAMYEGVLTLEKAMEQISKLKSQYDVLSSWVDMCDENNNKSVVYHDCKRNIWYKVK